MKDKLLEELSAAIKEQDHCQEIFGSPYSDQYKWHLRLEYARGRTSGIARAMEILNG